MTWFLYSRLSVFIRGLKKKCAEPVASLCALRVNLYWYSRAGVGITNRV